ncbi:MAG: cold shock domain-containing protein [Candidatus Magnetomorum sp.]|nr:cold shock domain-containing protein [Candidatus Magnetomorum sp.]
MSVNMNMIKKNLGTYTHAYGLNPKSDQLVQALFQLNEEKRHIGLIFRDPETRMVLINCRFPVNTDHTNQMLWIPINNRNLEVVPTFSKYASASDTHPQKWKKLHQGMKHQYDLISENQFALVVHRSFRTNGVIEKYNPKTGFGFIRRNRRDIFFISKWCKYNPIYPSQEVSFVPVISKKGLQARVIEPISF